MEVIPRELRGNVMRRIFTLENVDPDQTALENQA